MPSAPGGSGGGLLGLSPGSVAAMGQELFTGFLENYREGLPPSRVSREISVSRLAIVGQL